MKTVSTRQILVIEDDRDIAQILGLHLRDCGYGADLVHDGPQGLERALDNSYDLIILDLMLPGLEGLEICRRLRVQPNYTPTLMLTARSSEFDRILGLEVGADDYLTKPFSIRELLARVKALFRRLEALSAPAIEEPLLRSGVLCINRERRQVTLAGKPVNLTAKEFDLLVHFARHPGRVYTRIQLLDQVWGHGYEGYEHTVNSHINRLRTKIEPDPARPYYLHTVRGFGYRFRDHGEA